MITAEQMRMGRALLEWSQDDLAKSAGCAPSTIRRLEKGVGVPQAAVITLERIRKALSDGGALFVEADGEGGIGVRRKTQI